MHYAPFGKTGVQLSQLALGTGNFGTGWGHGAEADVSQAMLEAYLEAGGNIVDTADMYQFGESETILGKLLAGRRDEVFLASKFAKGASPAPGVLGTGNSRKAMVASLEGSLKRLDTDRIDLYWVHFPDDVTPTEELVRGLEDLSRSGKVLYVGLSNFPAWRIAHAATYAELTRAVPIAAAQFEHSLVRREAELDLFPACQSLGIGMMTYSPLGGGMLTGKYRKGEAGRAQGLGGKVFQAEDSAQRSAILDTLLEVAEELAAPADQVAIAWAATHPSTPLIGPRSLAQLQSNLAALQLQLSGDQVKRLDEVSQVVSLPVAR
ncbi:MULTISPECIES: aldo/keto reductase [unclassified Pseudomonas]|uniref:aldo/keto reductase n=1 Tax=unclassified Pseudomonas TaxID=196821 RepID=UPI0035BFB649